MAEPELLIKKDNCDFCAKLTLTASGERKTVFGEPDFMYICKDCASRAIDGITAFERLKAEILTPKVEMKNEEGTGNRNDGSIQQPGN